MAKTKILNATPMRPQPKMVCPECGKVHYSAQIASEASARKLCDRCYRKYVEKCKANGTYV